MRKEKLYKIAVIALLIINTGMIALYTLRPKHPPHPLERIKKTLNLNETQFDKFRRLADNHRNQMEELNGQQRELQKTYFTTSENNGNKDSLLVSITDLESQKIKITDQHFNDVKAILNASQLDDFEQFRKDALHMILQPAPPKRH